MIPVAEDQENQTEARIEATTKGIMNISKTVESASEAQGMCIVLELLYI